MVPVIAAAKGEEDPDAIGQPFMERAREIFLDKTQEVFRVKLGFEKEADVADDVWEPLESLLRRSRVDWTVFWRQLTYVARDFSDLESTKFEEMMTTLEDGTEEDGRSDMNPFYEPLTPELRKEWIDWIKQWRDALGTADMDGERIYEQMRTSNPKFVLVRTGVRLLLLSVPCSHWSVYSRLCRENGCWWMPTPMQVLEMRVCCKSCMNSFRNHTMRVQMIRSRNTTGGHQKEP